MHWRITFLTKSSVQFRSVSAGSLNSSPRCSCRSFVTLKGAYPKNKEQCLFVSFRRTQVTLTYHNQGAPFSKPNTRMIPLWSDEVIGLQHGYVRLDLHSAKLEEREWTQDRDAIGRREGRGCDTLVEMIEKFFRDRDEGELKPPHIPKKPGDDMSDILDKRRK
ncbi:hypothetical protein PROFUN_03277 [Planoprotostelium fungivorum]|uniref:Uncharacterized protein n=1 Tax=Planoprotostelium fungivorum TaxID=1890364 RepID=A0A2P6NWM7_9EUKA|nr:hypothetical protein PROFUN_03277 [Planoprotostelium fungivorum]